MPRFLPATFGALLFLSGCAGQSRTQGVEAVAPVTVGIIAINDFHGALEPPRQSVIAPDGTGAAVPIPAGGAAWLASAVKRVRQNYVHHVTVGAGDLIGASQFASSYYLDEPAIGVLNRIGLDLAAVGNHEFDRGYRELLRMQNGGCDRFARRLPCALERFNGARFRYLAASTITAEGRALLPASALRRFGKGSRRVTIGFIGLTLKDTPLLVTPEGVAGLTFADEADTINAEVPRLKARGADAVVVLIHEGGKPGDPPDPNGCNALSGAILPIVARIDPRVDAVVSGHTHRAYVCELPRGDAARSLLLTSAGNNGRLVTSIRLDIDPVGNRVVAASADNVIVQSPGYANAQETVTNSDAFARFEPDAEVASHVARYVAAARPVAARIAGRLAGPVAREASRGGTLGNLVADAQLAATADAGARIAFANPFGLRAPLIPAADGTMTYGDLFAAQPFDNLLVTQTLTGAEIREAIEQGLARPDTLQALAPSAGFRYEFDLSRRPGQRVISMNLDGAAIDPAASYRVTINSFLLFGGDGFAAFTRRREVTTGVSDLEALEAWLKSDPPRAVPAGDRTVDATPRP